LEAVLFEVALAEVFPMRIAEFGLRIGRDIGRPRRRKWGRGGIWVCGRNGAVRIYPLTPALSHKGRGGRSRVPSGLVLFSGDGRLVGIIGSGGEVLLDFEVHAEQAEKGGLLASLVAVESGEGIAAGGGEVFCQDRAGRGRGILNADF